jgi:uncharacterized protein YjeT (DUF2065 family)
MSRIWIGKEVHQMKGILYLIFLFFISTGCCYILYTQEMKKIFTDLMKKYDNRLIAVLPGLFGLLLLAGASSCRNAWFVVLIGLLAIGKGVLLFFNPQQFADKTIQWFTGGASDRTYRFFGIVALVMGTAMISWVK